MKKTKIVDHVFRGAEAKCRGKVQRQSELLYPHHATTQFTAVCFYLQLSSVDSLFM